MISSNMTTEQEFWSKVQQTDFALLSQADQDYLKLLNGQYHLTFQHLKQLCDYSLELAQWEEESFAQHFPTPFPFTHRQAAFSQLQHYYLQTRDKIKSYDKTMARVEGHPPLASGQEKEQAHKSLQWITDPEEKIIGRCPVASDKTLCCNLMTLDVAKNCSLGCHYCSIQSFMGGQYLLQGNLSQKLQQLSTELDPGQCYHIGTGQFSDSLLWGNTHGILDDLFSFATNHPNVILEFKTKTNHITPLLARSIPPNVLCTWSLAPQSFINSEEQFTASLEERLQAAERIASQGNLVGFHLHPMAYYEQWERDYAELISQMVNKFNPSQVAMVSFGTMTFTKKSIKAIRRKKMKSKILQMPLTEAEGKWSYPQSIKDRLFSFAYERFTPWHGQVFFYLCMEHRSYWQKIFGLSYQDNLHFERAMKENYAAKIKRIKNDHSKN